MRLKKKVVSFKIITVLLSLVLILAACSTNKSNEPKESLQASATNGTTEVSETSEPGVEAIDPMGKYDPPIEITSVRDLNPSTLFKPGESIENNVWTREYEQILGIKIKYLWTTKGGSGFEQKLNVSMASGDLPDITSVNAIQMQQLVESDQLEDLTELYEKYASPFTKKILVQDGGNALKSATSGGKLIALPWTVSAIESAPVLWVRTDWLKKLNLPEPKTMNDVFTIAEAFKNKNPSGNSPEKAFGLGVSKELFPGFPTLSGYFNGYHAYPRIWVKDASGNLVYGSIQPEIKPALLKLQEMYKAGLIDREFAVKDSGKSIEDIANGKLGIYYGMWWNPAYPLQDAMNKDPEMEWQGYAVPSIDENPAKIQVPFPVNSYFVVKKGSAHPEAVIKLLNLFMERNYSDNAEFEKFGIDKDGFQYVNYPLVAAYEANHNMNIHLHLLDALNKKDPSALSGEESGYYAKILDYRNGNRKNWTEEGMHGRFSGWPGIIEKEKNNLIVNQEFFGTPTKTMGERNSALFKLEEETFTKIIMGAAPIDEFDNFVTKWNSLGGKEITQEVKEWQDKNK